MCDGGISAIILGTLSAVASAAAASQQAKQQARYQELQAEEYQKATELNNKAAAKEYVEQSAAESIKDMQEKAAAAKEKQEIQKDALQKQGTMLASTNASGLALDYLMADYDRQEGNQMDTVSEQQGFNAVGHEINKQAYQRKAQNTMNSQQGFVSQGTSGGASVIGTALQIGSATLSGYNTYRKYKDDNLSRKTR